MHDDNDRRNPYLKKLVLGCLFLLLSLPGWAQESQPPQPMKSMEFRDQNIRDILLALGELNNVSIVPDETVVG